MKSLAILAVLAGVVHAAPAPRAIIVWPRGPDTDVAGTDDAAARAGLRPVAFAALRARLVEQGARATAADTAALDVVQAALAAARAAYLAQQFADMAGGLAAAEAACLTVLVEPSQIATLWELELQRGLAELARGDAGAARSRFALAIALDATRAPRRELYGPAVVRGFTDAVDAQAAIPPRPTALHVSPADARIAIDGLAVVDNAAPRNLRPGLHAVIARAPGYTPVAAMIDLRAGQPIEITLAPADGDPVARLGAAWARGELDVATASGRAAILAAADAALVLVVDRDREPTAQLLTDRELAPIARAATPALAAAAALAHLDAAPVTSPPPASRSVLRSPWLWAGVTAVAAAAIVTGVVLAPRDHTIRVLPPAP